MITLGIETSCDETSVAVLEGKHGIRSNVVSSSLFRHQPFGGVVPEIACRHSLEQIDFVLEQALKQANAKIQDVDLIAVTQGPGLIGSLFVGVCFAKALSFHLKKPLVGVNHLEAHLTANFIGHEAPERYLGLLVSGGHTSISYHEGAQMKIIGETVDDACGEAYDKVAKILGLGFPGGPIIDKLAAQGNEKAYKFTRPKQENSYDFSFSGVKTAVLYLTRRQKSMTDEFKRDVAASFQRAAVSWLVEKSIAAAEDMRVSDIVVGGGVSANSRLRKDLQEAAGREGIRTWFPPLALTGDNAAMIARQGLDLYEKGVRDTIRLNADPNLRVKGRKAS
ncbi:MAG TPA: tRNA (adenosine(37)-N6)-threonylcarbamoyltransferase complex transferase subunit TsaD [Verrucomicrobiae bacterium]|jgi:N6-L-threonylcarbamoyladenine synthase|nr:tRNA (adenosine(37)-N6)-threonylcarbamoyltransferase complex transferase subunit TsaD [Verrucomicrobiae bacterium]